MDGSLTAVSPEARIYALTELIRRAGVTGEFYKRWEVESTPLGDLVVRPQRGASGQVRFPLASGELQIDEVVRKTWHGEAPAEFRDVVPNFIVPFSTPASVAGRPLFTQEGPGRFSCTEDILASIVLTLSRFEEIVSPARDDHGRFPASASAAFCRNYLNRPIVDEYGLALQQILELLMPGWRPAPRALRVKITHDLDQIGIPFSLKSTIGHLLKRKSPLFFMRDFLSLGTGVEPAFLKQVRDICQLSLQRHLHSTLYWMASTPGPSDWGYDVEDLRIARVMRWAREHDVEMGVHPGYDTFLSPALLEQQVQRCRKALQNERIGGRQHYLRWCPKTWVHWERCGLLYDSSVGFVNYPGFRAGTCVPYLPWLWLENRRADLLEIPLVVMDVALLAIDHGKVLEVVEKLVQRCAVVGGVCTLVWHNNRLASPEGRYYPGVLDALSSGSDYDWQTDLAQLRQLACNGSQHKLSSATKRAGIAHTAARREAVVTGTNDCGRA
jgi:hypothetical protein